MIATMAADTIGATATAGMAGTTATMAATETTTETEPRGAAPVGRSRRR